MVQDQRGFIWLGTEEGLNRFDGYEFEIFRHDPLDSGSISDNHILTLFVDVDARLWAGSVGGGLNLMDQNLKTFTHFRHDPDDPSSIASDRVMCIDQDRLGQLWVGTSRGGLNKMSGDGRFDRYFYPESGEGQNAVLSIEEDSNGLLWLGTSDGLKSFDPVAEFFSSYDLNFNTENPSIAKIFHDREGNLWLGSRSGLWRRVSGQTGFRQIQTSFGNHRVNDIYEDQSGDVWIGAEGVGLYRIHPSDDSEHSRVTHYRKQEHKAASLSSNLVTSIFEDQTGTLFVGTWGGGVNVWNRSSEHFRHERHDPAQPDSLSHPWVSSITRDRNGVLWVGTYGGGVNKAQDRSGGSQRFDHLRHDVNRPGSLSHDWVYTIYQDLGGVIWVGTRGGLDRWRPEQRDFAHYHHDPADPESLGSNRVCRIYQDSGGNLWVGSRDGTIHRWRARDLSQGDARFENFPRSPEQENADLAWITLFHEDRHGQMWIGSFGDGLSRWSPSQPDRMTHFRHDPKRPSSLSNDVVYCMYEDGSGVFWVGTDSGLNRLEDAGQDVFENYRQKDGQSQVIYGVLGDESGHLWVSTNGGLARFDPDDGKFHVFDIQDGLQDEYNVGAYYRAHNGEMFFGGIDGLNHFFPNQIKDNPHRPEVVITEILLNNKPVPFDTPEHPSPLSRAIEQTDFLTLNHQHQVFSLKFAALHYQNPKRNRYAYQLEPFDKQWIETDAEHRTATYTSLDAGDYLFRVKASNKDGVWNETGTSLRLKIKPAPWWSWWAKTLYVLSTIALILGVFQHQSHRRKLREERALNERYRQIDKLKDEFLAKTSHELRTPLQGIIGLCESMTAGVAGPLPPKAIANLSMVTVSGQRLAGLVDNILDFSKLENEGLDLKLKPLTIRPLVDMVLAFAYPQLRNGVELINRVSSDLTAVMADEDRLSQILHNLVANAVRFTDQGAITISAESTGEQVVIRVEDTGKGIAPEDLDQIFEPFRQSTEGDNRGGTGLGLAVTRQLITLHGSEIQVDSEPGRGSRFQFHLDVADSANPSNSIQPNSEPVQKIYPPENPDAPFHILIVDDEPVNRLVLINHLSLSGYRISEAAGGVEAVALLEKGPVPDLMLLDIMMPDMTGYELCQGIRARYASHELPIIFLTAKAQTSDLVSGLEIGANDYLTKPVARDELLARIKVHLDLLEINRTLEQKVEQRTLEVKDLQVMQARFFTDVSHELRAPLTLITAPISDLLDKADDSARSHLERVRRNARRMALLVDQLLNISKLDLGLMRLQARCADLAAFVIEQTKAFLPWAERKQLSLTWEAPGIVSVWFDADKIQKILFNLLSNAMKNTPEGGSVLLKMAQDQNWITISVKDTGPGLSRERLAHIFDRFQPGAGLQTDSSGIGLSLARDLAVLHGGDIRVESDPGFGAEFILSLPRTSAYLDAANDPGELSEIQPILDEAVSIESNPETADHQTSILIAEDHHELLEYLAQTLGASYHIMQANDGATALDLSRKHLPDLIISDVLMPGLKGDELCKAIKEDPLTCHIPVILLTARISLDHKITALQHGADAYLAKPFDMRELMATVANLIEQRNLLSRRMDQANRPPSPDDSFLERVETILDQHLGDPEFGVYELAEEIGFSRRQLLRKIKALTGGSPADKIRSYRLEQAARILQTESGHNISEIAYRVGFKHPAHFSSLFREQFGKTPSQFARDPLV